MKKNKILHFIFSLACIAVILVSNSISAMDILSMWPYDTSIRPTSNKQRRWQVGAYLEGQYARAKSYGDDGGVANPLRIWNCQQNALTMLQGFPEDSPISQLRVALGDADNGIRGRFIVDGDLRVNFSTAFLANLYFASDWRIGLYLPVYDMTLKDVHFIDQTPNVDNLDKLVHQLLTDHLAQTVCQLGHLNIGNWHRAGVGDLTALVEWFRDFPQNKPFLKMVRVNWRWGVGFPTGLRTNNDLIFAIPFGYDGAVSMPFGLGLDLNLGQHFKCGIDIQLTQIFGHTRARRIKTNVDQTELLLLQTTQVFKDSGLVQRFNLYLELLRIPRGLSFKIGYQYLKQGTSEYSLKTQQFSNNIANTSPRLDEFTMHHMIPKLTYNFGVHNPNARTRPELGLYMKIPFNGKNVVLFPSIGGVVSVDF